MVKENLSAIQHRSFKFTVNQLTWLPLTMCSGGGENFLPGIWYRNLPQIYLLHFIESKSHALHEYIYIASNLKNLASNNEGSNYRQYNLTFYDLIGLS